jgi:TetR/AcrR family transcriptional regulator, mexJK operon transcriptional repressor
MNLPLPANSADPVPVVERILRAAQALFFAHGFAAVSTELLAREACVSKATLYKHFADLHAVLEAVIEREADLLTVGVPELPHTAAAYWTALRTYGVNLLTLLNRTDVIHLDRLLHEQARGHPRLGQLYFDATYGRALGELGTIITYGQTRKFIRTDADAAVLAEWLLSMWEAMAFQKARLGLTTTPFPNPQGWVDQCVDRLFGADVW